MDKRHRALPCLLVWLFACVLSTSLSAQIVSINSPVSGSLFQHTDWVADIPVTASASGVPIGGGVVFVLDQGTPLQMVIPAVLNSGRYTGVFRNVLLGEHTLDAFIRNSAGLTVAQTRVTRVGVGDIIIALGDSITLGEVDDIYNDNWSADGRNGPAYTPTGEEWGGFEPILNDLLTSARGYPHSVINVGVSGERASQALARLGQVIAQYPMAKTWLVSYGTNDTNSGVSPASFKSSLGGIVTQIQGSIPGASVYLSKIFYFSQSDSDRWRIPHYQNGMADIIQSTPGVYWGADLDTLFRSNNIMYPGHEQGKPGTWLARNKTHHPNGIGIQKMGMLWKMLLVDGAILVTDGIVSSLGSTYGDRIAVAGANRLGLNQNNLLLICESTARAISGVQIVDPQTFRLALTGDTGFKGGLLEVTIRTRNVNNLPAGRTLDDVVIMRDSVALPTMRWADSNSVYFKAQVDAPGQIALGVPEVTELPPTTDFAITPSSPDGRNGWYATRPTITLASDSSSGVSSNYRWDSNGWNLYTGPLDAILGKHTFSYRSVRGTAVESESSVVLKVDYTPPTKPVVAPGVSTLRVGVPVSLQWQSGDPESGIDKYWYAIGTTPGSTNVQGWKDTQSSSFAFTPAAPVGSTYYISVKVRNRAGVYGDIGVSSGIRIVN